MFAYQSQHTLVTKVVQHKITYLLEWISLCGKLGYTVRLLQNMMKRCLWLPQESLVEQFYLLFQAALFVYPCVTGALVLKSGASRRMLPFWPLSYPKMFPELAQFFPGVLTLNNWIPAPSQYEANAHRALLRLEAVVPLVRERLVDPTAASIHNTQCALTEAFDDAESVIVLAAIKRDDNPLHPIH